MIPIWEGEIPYFDPEFRQFPPSLTDYLLPGENNPGCLVIPGGGYHFKAWDHEGTQIAEWLNKIGISALVLDYRVRPYDGNAILADGRQAFTKIRANAKEYGIDPRRLGVIGFSAGGHLAGCLATMFESPEQRPDFALLCYAVLNLMQTPFTTHKGTSDTFLGAQKNDPEAQKYWSPRYRVTPDCPPAFFWTTDTDTTVPPIPCTQDTYRAWVDAGVEAEMVCFDHGVHGLGIPADDPEIASWTDKCEAWLKKIGILN